MSTNIRYTCSYPPSGESGDSSQDKALVKQSWKRIINENTAVQVLGDEPQKLVYIKNTDTVYDALKTLKENGIQCALMFDPKTSQVQGLLDILDLVTFVARKCLGTFTANREEDRRAFINELFNQKVEPLFNVSERNWWFAALDNSPFEMLFQYLALQDLKRIVVFDHNDPIRRTVIGVLTQFDIIKWINTSLKKELQFSSMEHDENLLIRNILQHKVKKDEKVKEIVKFTLDDKLVNVFESLYEQKVTAVPIVDRGNQKLVGTISASDLKILADHPDKILEIMDITCREFINKYQANLQGRGNRIYCTCKPDDNILLVVRNLAELKVHRSWVINEKEEVVGVISLCDIIDAFQHFVQ